MHDSNNEVFRNNPNKNLPPIKLFSGKKNFENFALMVFFPRKDRGEIVNGLHGLEIKYGVL